MWKWNYILFTYLCIFKILFIFREKARDRNIDVWEKHRLIASHMPPTGYLAHNPAMCPDWEWNGQPFGSQAEAQSTEPH